MHRYACVRWLHVCVCGPLPGVPRERLSEEHRKLGHAAAVLAKLHSSHHPVCCLLLRQVAYSASQGWQAYSSDRDTRGVRLEASGELSPDGTAVTLRATTQRAGQVVVSAGYGWATWPVVSLFGGAGAPAIPWWALAPNTSEPVLVGVRRAS